MRSNTRRGLLRRLGWGSLAALLVVGAAVMAVVLFPNRVWATSALAHASGQVDYRTGARTSVQVALVRHDHEWRGQVADFPPGSVTRFRPANTPSLYIVRWSDGTFRALSARSARSGDELVWLRGSNRLNKRGEKAQGALCEPIVADCYEEDGEVTSGPGWRPLARFAVSNDSQHLSVAVRPNCTDSLTDGLSPFPRYQPIRGMAAIRWWLCQGE